MVEPSTDPDGRGGGPARLRAWWLVSGVVTVIVVGLAGELVIVRDPQLGPLSDGIWPCADGGLQGNPVIV